MHPLAQWLRQRAEQGKPLRQYELADEVDCAASRITQILQGGRPSLKLAVKLSKLTKIPVEQFERQP